MLTPGSHAPALSSTSPPVRGDTATYLLVSRKTTCMWWVIIHGKGQWLSIQCPERKWSWVGQARAPHQGHPPQLSPRCLGEGGVNATQTRRWPVDSLRTDVT